MLVIIYYLIDSEEEEDIWKFQIIFYKIILRNNIPSQIHVMVIIIYKIMWIRASVCRPNHQRTGKNWKRQERESPGRKRKWWKEISMRKGKAKYFYLSILNNFYHKSSNSLAKKHIYSICQRKDSQQNSAVRVEKLKFLYSKHKESGELIYLGISNYMFL